MENDLPALRPTLLASTANLHQFYFGYEKFLENVFYNLILQKEFAISEQYFFSPFMADYVLDKFRQGPSWMETALHEGVVSAYVSSEKHTTVVDIAKEYLKRRSHVKAIVKPMEVAERFDALGVKNWRPWTLAPNPILHSEQYDDRIKALCKKKKFEGVPDDIATTLSDFHRKFVGYFGPHFKTARRWQKQRQEGGITFSGILKSVSQKVRGQDSDTVKALLDSSEFKRQEEETGKIIEQGLKVLCELYHVSLADYMYLEPNLTSIDEFSSFSDGTIAFSGKSSDEFDKDVLQHEVSVWLPTVPVLKNTSGEFLMECREIGLRIKYFDNLRIWSGNPGSKEHQEKLLSSLNEYSAKISELSQQGEVNKFIARMATNPIGSENLSQVSTRIVFQGGKEIFREGTGLDIDQEPIFKQVADKTEGYIASKVERPIYLGLQSAGRALGEMRKIVKRTEITLRRDRVAHEYTVVVE